MTTERKGKCWHFAGIARRFTTARGVLVGIGVPYAVRKYSLARRADVSLLTVLSNVVAYACRDSIKRIGSWPSQPF